MLSEWTATAAVTAVEEDSIRLGDALVRVRLPAGRIAWPAVGAQVRIVACDVWCSEGSALATAVFVDEQPWLVHFDCGRPAGGACAAGFSVRWPDSECPYEGDCCRRRPGLIEWTTPTGSTTVVGAGRAVTDAAAGFVLAAGAQLEETECCEGDYTPHSGNALAVRSAP